jgi:hypothetical protein
MDDPCPTPLSSMVGTTSASSGQSWASVASLFSPKLSRDLCAGPGTGQQPIAALSSPTLPMLLQAPMSALSYPALPILLHAPTSDTGLHLSTSTLGLGIRFYPKIRVGFSFFFNFGFLQLRTKKFVSVN